MALAAEARAAWSGMYGHCQPQRCVVSPLDMPVTPYTMPRRPAWGGSSYAYHVKPSPQNQFCGCGWATEQAGTPTDLPYPVEIGDTFVPVKFERIGQIPHDPLLGAGPVVPSGH
jgi:hypothetical protein